MVRVITYRELNDRRKELREMYVKTVNQNQGKERFIPQVKHAVISQILEELKQTCFIMDARRKLVSVPTSCSGVCQLGFEFYFTCSISPNEVPF